MSKRPLFVLIAVSIFLLPANRSDAAEGRIPIAGPTTITTSGSYIVTQDFTGAGAGIIINANHVTIDLDGHTVASTSTTENVITNGSSGSNDIHIKNGKLNGGLYHIHFLAPGGGQFSVENVTLGPQGVNAGTGILIRGGGAGMAGRAVIRRNVILSSNDDGIFLENMDTSRVEENEVSGYSSAGIDVINARTMIIAGNTVFQGDDGIKVSNCDDSQILRNNVSSIGADALLLLNGSDRNLVEANNLSNSSSGVAIISSHHNMIVNNIANGNGTYGIGIFNVSTNNNIRHNTASGNGLSFPYAGIYLNNTANTRNIIDWNVMSGNTGHGLRFDSGSTGNLFSYNRTAGNTAGGMTGLAGNFNVSNNFCAEGGGSC